jgi:citrate lyase beta subunit
LDLKDNAKLRSEAQAARNLGFTGKLAIHPGQVPILNELFSPTEAEIENAHKALAAFSASGFGVLTVDGRMVDEAVVRRARQVLRMCKGEVRS